jgi:hypothetical protein
MDLKETRREDVGLARVSHHRDGSSENCSNNGLLGSIQGRLCLDLVSYY